MPLVVKANVWRARVLQNMCVKNASFFIIFFLQLHLSCSMRRKKMKKKMDKGCHFGCLYMKMPLFWNVWACMCLLHMTVQATVESSSCQGCRRGVLGLWWKCNSQRELFCNFLLAQWLRAQLSCTARVQEKVYIEHEEPQNVPHLWFWAAKKR